MKNYFSLIVLLSSVFASFAQEFKTKDIVRHISILAHDSLSGRGTGTTGEQKARTYIQSQFKNLGLIPKGDEGQYFQKFDFRKGAHGQGESGSAYNIVGYLDNKASNTIIIGAHYDHLGLDGQGSSLDANPAEKIHNGADDNASGVAGVIELARHFATNKIKENHNFLFLCFSGEELGLLGSKYFTEHSPVDLSTINFMFNMDMIGRLNPQTKSLLIHGTGTSSAWQNLIQRLASKDLQITTDSSGIGPSDHTSFYLKNIPALHFFTGSHSDYHKPSDDVDKINAEGEVAVLKLMANLIAELDKQPKLTFLQTRAKKQTTMSSFKVTLGIMPSYASDVEGLKVDGVTDGKPASKAGILTGDVIIQIGEYQIKDIYGYMDALSKFDKDQTVPVKLKREKQEMTVMVTF